MDNVEENTVTTNNNTIREDLVKTAINFLQNPNVMKTSLTEQQNFLKRKGLTNDEIRLACEQSGAYSRHEDKNRSLVSIQPTLYRRDQNTHLTLFERFREIVHNVAVLSFVAYAIYKFYQRFIAPYLFGTRKKSVEDTLEKIEKDMEKSVNELKDNVTSIRVEVDKMNNVVESNTQKHLSDLKLEMSTIKGLLLNRKLFPAPTTLVPQSIPAWQKASLGQDSDPDSDPEKKGEDELNDANSGCSDHNTKTSDSSLEIISYSSKDYESDFQRQRSKEDISHEGV